MRQTTITVGRNLAGTATPMRRERWREFQAAAVAYLRGEGCEVLGPFTGEGEWEGTVEESAIIVGLKSDHLLNGTVSLEEFCQNLARHYSQDAVAWSYGESNLAQS